MLLAPETARTWVLLMIEHKFTPHGVVRHDPLSFSYQRFDRQQVTA